VAAGNRSIKQQLREYLARRSRPQFDNRHPFVLRAGRDLDNHPGEGRHLRQNVRQGHIERINP